MKTIFVTATGTDIGKTLVTTALCYQLHKKGHRVRGIKPVISGWPSSGEGSDTVHILQSLSLPVTEVTIAHVSPWRFTQPVSPHMAAAREGKSVTVAEIAEFCQSLTYNEGIDYLIIEGAGGVMTPLNHQETIIDLISVLQPQVMLVTGSYLGSLSHTLTAVEALISWNMPPASVIVSESAASTVSLAETLDSLKQFIALPVVGLPRMAHSPEPWATVPVIHVE